MSLASPIAANGTHAGLDRAVAHASTGIAAPLYACEPRKDRAACYISTQPLCDRPGASWLPCRWARVGFSRQCGSMIRRDLTIQYAISLQKGFNR